jgi:hypothetical protein
MIGISWGVEVAPWVAIVIAAIPLWWQVKRLRGENTDQHYQGRAIINTLVDSVADLHVGQQRIEAKVDNLSAQHDDLREDHHDLESQVQLLAVARLFRGRDAPS